MIVARDCENKQLKGPFSLSCSSDTQSQLLSASTGVDVSGRVIFYSVSQNLQMHIPGVFLLLFFFFLIYRSYLSKENSFLAD